MRDEGGLTRQKLFLAAALLLMAGGCAYAYFTSPTWLTVAVGPAGSPDEKLLRAFAGQLKAQRVALRIKILPVSDVKAAAEALDRNKAELAVVRPDVLLPQDGLSLAILREAAAIVIVPSTTAGIESVSDLTGKTLGVAVGHDADPQFIASLLAYYDLGPSAVPIVPLARGDALAALQEGKVDAVAILAPPAGTVASDFVRSVAAAYSGKITILPVENVDAIVQRSPGAAEVSIAEGVWGGRPKIPEHEMKTVGISYRLVARSDLDRSTVALVTESLFQMRSRLVSSARSAIFLKAPDTETTSAATPATLPNHPGAVDYFQREQQSLMDRYSDWIYLVAFFGSGLISLWAAFSQRFQKRSREAIDDVLDRLLAILADARAAETPGRLDEITAEVDDLLTVAVQHARAGDTGSRTTSALVLALDGARSAIEDRRRQIGAGSGEVPRRDATPRLVSLLATGQGSVAAGRTAPST